MFCSSENALIYIYVILFTVSKVLELVGKIKIRTHLQLPSYLKQEKTIPRSQIVFIWYFNFYCSTWLHNLLIDLWTVKISLERGKK